MKNGMNIFSFHFSFHFTFGCFAFSLALMGAARGISFLYNIHNFFGRFLCILPIDFYPEIVYNVGTTKEKEEPQMTEWEILKYGKYITDESYTTWDHHVYRLRAIRYKDHLYWHKMIDGEVVEFKILR